jgi:glycosyltransferase involved in cell wall biosynthesis
MKIAFDAQLLFEAEKTGVGYVAHNYIKQLISLYPNDDFIMRYFACREAEQKYAMMNKYRSDNVEIETSSFPGTVYKLLSTLLPFPYSKHFKSNVDVELFFNYIIPPGVKGKKIVFIHDMVFCKFPETVRANILWILRLTFKHTIKRADCIITGSEFAKREILKYNNFLPEERIKVIPDGIDLQYYEQANDSSKIPRMREKYGMPYEYILYLGTLEPRKNIERLIEAYAVAKSTGDMPPLVIAGRKGWMYDSIFQRLIDLKLHENVIFLGYFPDEDKPVLYAGAKFFIFPSLYEGFGLPPLEAMACGTPVIVSNATSLPEVCGDAAIYIDPMNIASIADVLVRLNTDCDLRQNLIKCGLERSRKFDWSVSAEQLYKLCKEI